MARTKLEILNEQIRKAEEDVIRTGDRYNLKSRHFIPRIMTEPILP